MAKFDYNRPKATANRLIDRFGQVGAIRRTVITHPENNWEEGTETTTYHAITVAILPMDEKRIDGSLILTGDRQALMAMQGLSITPVVGDIVLFNGSFVASVYNGGEAWTIKKLDTLAPAGTVVLFDAVVRR